MTDTLAAAFDTKLQETIRKEASFGDAITVTAVVVQKQLVDEGIIKDSAQSFLAAHGALVEAMNFADEQAIEWFGKAVAPELRNETLGSAARMILNMARERKSTRDKQQKLKKSLGEGVSLPEGGALA